MSITDELREYIDALTTLPITRSNFIAIANRIDAEHEAKVSYWQGACYRDGYNEGFAGADNWMAQNEDAMAEHGWIRLPVDADGVPISIGDVMVYADGNTCPMNVVALVPPSVFLTDEGPRYADMCRHKPTTVEDVLREFAEKITDSQIPGVHPTYEETIAEYAAKLQLREVPA